MENYIVNRRQVVTGGVIAAFTALWKPVAALADTPPDAAREPTSSSMWHV